MGRGRIVILAAGMVVAGSSVGYLYATHVAFPLPESRTEEYRDVPDLRGLRLEEAQGLLAELGLALGTVDTISYPDSAGGSIVGQDPFPGQLALPSGAVELTVSGGPEYRTVPDVASMRLDRAMVVLQTSGFEVAVDSVEAEVPPGRVISTSPPAGETAALPTRVRLTVSLGPPGFPMPGLEGMEEDVARLLLDSLGLVVGEVERTFTFTRGGEVIRQFPPVDSIVARGTEVRLQVGRGF
jgi:serine/threonine-protein kinase